MGSCRGKVVEEGGQWCGLRQGAEQWRCGRTQSGRSGMRGWIRSLSFFGEGRSFIVAVCCEVE